jgi:hypothetical protein
MGRKPASFERLVCLNYLAPDIVAAILDGEQPERVTRKWLMQTDLPIDWTLQRRLLGFPPHPRSDSASVVLEMDTAHPKLPVETAATD